jgi:hypothetical protein
LFRAPLTRLAFGTATAVRSHGDVDHPAIATTPLCLTLFGRLRIGHLGSI